MENFTNKINETIGKNNSGGEFYVDELILKPFAKTTIVVLYSLISIIGVIGNIAIIHMFLNKKNRNSTSVTFILSLAVSDLLASIFIPLVMINDIVSPDLYVFGIVGCKVLPSMSILTTLASAWNLVLISVDRLRVIYFPFSAMISKWKRMCGVALVWTIALTITSPMSYHLILSSQGCWDVWNSPQDRFLYITLFEISTCLIPIVILIIAYAMSARKLIKSQLETENHTILVRLKQNQKITKMFALIVVIFVLLTTPYLVILFTITYYATYDIMTYYNNIKVLQALNYGLFILSAFNSTVNCFVYAKFHGTIVKGMSRVSLRVSRWSTSIRKDSTTMTHFGLKRLESATPLTEIDCENNNEQNESL